MEKEKLNKLNVKLEKDLDEDIIEILNRVQNKTLFTKTAIRLAYQQMLEDPSIARVREPMLFKWDKFIQDVEDNKSNSISCISKATVVDTSNNEQEYNDSDKSSSKTEEKSDDLEDEELF